jgi:hypothetical protein
VLHYPDVPFQLSNPPPKPPKPAPFKRPPKEPEPTRREKELEHFMYNWTGGRDPSGRAYADPITPDEEWFRHHFWKEKRAKVLAALASAGTPTATLEAFTNCGAECIVEWNATEERYRIRGNYCHNRHCEPCMKAKASLLAANLRGKLEERPNELYRFVTLTLKHTDTPLLEQIKRLYASFTKLRSSKCWKQSQRGGAGMLEVKWDPATRQWHPHLHVVVQGGYLAKETLSAAWHHATGDSFIVDIRKLDARKDVAFYVAKYVTKGTNAEVWDDADAAAEWICATRGLRTCATFGTWRGFKLLAKPESKGAWLPVCRLGSLISRARAGDEAARETLEALRAEQQYNPHKARKRQSG